MALPVILLAPVAWLVLRMVDRARAERLERLVGPRVRALTGGPDAHRRLRRTLLCGGLLLALVAAAQPRWGDPDDAHTQRGVDVLVCLDVSRSMLARDQAPDRLSAARREILALAERARGDRLGLVAFAGEAALAAPLTSDMESFASLLAQTGPLSVQRGGTDLGAALETALAALPTETGEHEVVLLLTDGEDIEGRGLQVAGRLAERGVAVHCVGFGSLRGSKITIERDGVESFLRDRAGSEVVSAMDPASLRRIAEVTGGDFLVAERRPQPLVELYETRVLPMARKTFEERRRRELPNRYQWALAAAFALWILELCLTDRKLS
jgi:Ca-activated chloride channel family protein